MNDAEMAIRCRGLRVVRAGRTVLPDLDLEVQSGQLVGLLGPSGCGKSTLMRSIVGAQRVAGGEVTVLGLPAGHPRLRSRVGYLTQSVSVYDDLTVTENLEYFAVVVGAADGDVSRVLQDVDLTARTSSLVSQLSGGERARVSLAVALLGRPELLVLDEPTVGLDPVLRRDLWQLFRSLAESGVTLLVSSHVMDEATRCDRLVMLYEGRLLADGTLPQLLERTSARDADDAFLALAQAAAG